MLYIIPHKKSERKKMGRKPRLDMAGFHNVVNKGMRRAAILKS